MEMFPTHTEKLFAHKAGTSFLPLISAMENDFPPTPTLKSLFFAACGVPPYSSLPSHSAITHSCALLFPLSEEFSLFQAIVIQQIKLSRQSGSDNQNLFLA